MVDELESKGREQYIVDLAADLHKLDAAALTTVRALVDRKLRGDAKEPWQRHFERAVWQSPLGISELAKLCRVPESTIRRVFIAGKAPGNWLWRDLGRGPLWPTTMLSRWRETVAAIDENSLPPDGKLIRGALPEGAFGLKEV